MAPPGQGAHLALEGLTRRFGAVTALDGLTLDVKEGEFVCLVGPSGCGKTTALRIVAGLETPTSGRVTSLGRDITATPPADRGMGMVFQSYALFPNMTAERNIAFALDPGRDAASRRARVAELLEIVDLAASARKRPHELSGGQQQRVAMARALAREPRILLLDEPLSALDPQIRGRLREELKSLQRRLGVTTLMVTHDQAEALAIADRIAVMRAGRLLQVGTPREIYQRPADAFTGQFVGAMNLIPAVADGPDGVRILGDLRLAAPHDFAAGTAVVVAIRPEFVRISAADSDARPATVRAREFQGAFVRLTLSVAGLEAPLLADVPSEHASAAEGEVVRVHIPATQVRLFPGAETA